MRPRQEISPKRNIFIIVVFTLVCSVLMGTVAFYWIRIHTPDVPPPEPLFVPEADEASTLPLLTLYFLSRDNWILVGEDRGMPPSPDLGETIKAAVEGLSKGPAAPTLAPTFPQRAKLLAIYIDQEQKSAYLDFNAAFFDQPDSILMQWATIYSLVNTVCGLSTGIEKVILLQEGEEVEGWAGHWDLGRPLYPNLALVSPE